MTALWGKAVLAHWQPTTASGYRVNISPSLFASEHGFNQGGSQLIKIFRYSHGAAKKPKPFNWRANWRMYGHHHHQWFAILCYQEAFPLLGLRDKTAKVRFGFVDVDGLHVEILD